MHYLNLLKNFLRCYLYIFRYKLYLLKIKKVASLISSNDNVILAINHHYDQDLDMLEAGFDDELKIVRINPMPTFNRALLYFKNNDERDGFIPYSKLDKVVLKNYNKICKSIFKDLHQITKFKILLMPSDSFWWIREFVSVCKENNIPTIVLDKEGTITPHDFEVHSQQIRERFPFISDHLLVWTERQKEFWIKSGCPKEKIKIVGQPRSDFYFKPALWKSKSELEISDYKSIILFFTFDLDAYISAFPPEEIKRNNLSWKKLRDDINSIILELARNYVDNIFLIKTHPQQSDIEYLKSFFKSANLPNIRLIEGAAISNQLIINSDIIIGFQTTALIESMLTNKHIIYTQWGETEKKIRADLIPFHESNALIIADSQDNFKSILTSLLDNKIPNNNSFGDQRTIFSNYWLNADGKVAARVKEFLKETITYEH